MPFVASIVVGEDGDNKRKEGNGMNNTLGRGYAKFLNDIKLRIVTAQIQAVRFVNKELIKLYWDIGKSIIERQKKKWGGGYNC